VGPNQASEMGPDQTAEPIKPFLEATAPFYKDIEEMTHYQVTANG
jgi:hypothetical protein